MLKEIYAALVIMTIMQKSWSRSSSGTTPFNVFDMTYKIVNADFAVPKNRADKSSSETFLGRPPNIAAS